VKSATAKGYEEATDGDSINLCNIDSETRRGRVGKGIAQTLDTGCNQAVMIVKNGRTEEEKKRRREHKQKTGKDSGSFKDKNLLLKQQEYSDTILANPNPIKEGLIAQLENKDVAMLGYTRDAKGNVVKRNIWDETGTIHTSSGSGGNTDQFVIQYNDKRLNETISKNELPEGEPKAIDTYNQKVQDNAPTLTEPHHNTTRLWDGYKIRRLTPRECFRLMDFPDTFTWPVSDSQAYKQAGNSIVVNVLYKIIKNLNLKS
jgi:site-specific DNA-cytosine methylase